MSNTKISVPSHVKSGLTYYLSQGVHPYEVVKQLLFVDAKALLTLVNRSWESGLRIQPNLYSDKECFDEAINHVAVSIIKLEAKHFNEAVAHADKALSCINEMVKSNIMRSETYNIMFTPFMLYHLHVIQVYLDE